MSGRTIASVILAGGKGTRLFPLTNHHAKPAVPFAGKYRLIDIPLSNSINSNMREIFVIAQFLTAELQHHIHQTYHFGPLLDGQVNFLTPQETTGGEKIWFEGTADAVRKNLSTLLATGAEYFLILSGDQLYNIDFQEMFLFAQKTDADLTIASLPVQKESAHRLGILEIDAAAKVLHFIEKPEKKEELNGFILPKRYKDMLGCMQEEVFLASMGIYIFKRNALEKLLLEDDREDFGKHLIPKEITQGKTYAYIYEGYWEDIGTIRSFYEANLAFLRGEKSLYAYDEKHPIFSSTSYLPGPIVENTTVHQSMLSDGCVIQGEKLIHSIIGPKVHIGEGTIIKNSIIMGVQPSSHLAQEQPLIATIGKNCLIENAIIDEHVCIEDGVSLQNASLKESFDSKDVYIREGIIIATKNAHITRSLPL